MSRRNKHLIQAFLNEDPTPTGNQVIARVHSPRGNNLHEVELADGSMTLAELPARFRNVIWVKRGSYAVLQPYPGDVGKVWGEIAHVLFPDHVSAMKKRGEWPAEWAAKEQAEEAEAAKDAPAATANEESESDSDDDDELFHNPNRGHRAEDSSDDSDSSDDE
ncbi:hypothetical protein H9P43_007259 [Blastocladiella emersonii ATCC 22665]|nr:hypothetical protein H9P43_007259 [Blastocladiella emersonii ATCC 22665]